MRLETTQNIDEIVEMVEKARENELQPRPYIIDYFERLYEYNGNERYLQMFEMLNRAMDEITLVPRDRLNI